ncbi:MAG: hypothetical protein KAW01_08850 [Deltaproteobacteria bacterium]|nr:hypothetical protein [Deltaproteobacteria bacterium]
MDKFAALKADIERELQNLDRLTLELNTVLTTTNPNTAVRVRATGSVIHDFYTGVEKIFRRIATRVDQDLPTGEDWHVQLLQRMSVPLEEIRPQVIDEHLERNLEEYLRFRHLFRNIYGFELKWGRCQPLAERLHKTFADLKEQIGDFRDFLGSI